MHSGSIGPAQESHNVKPKPLTQRPKHTRLGLKTPLYVGFFEGSNQYKCVKVNEYMSGGVEKPL